MSKVLLVSTQAQVNAATIRQRRGDQSLSCTEAHYHVFPTRSWSLRRLRRAWRRALRVGDGYPPNVRGEGTASLARFLSPWLRLILPAILASDAERAAPITVSI